MSSLKFPTRRLELDTSFDSSFRVPIGRATRLPKGPLGDHSNTDHLNSSRVERVNNLFFDERTVSRTHAYLSIDCQHSGVKLSFPSIVLEDNGSQHGVVWEGKRIPKNAKIRIRENDCVGLVDVANRNQEFNTFDFAVDSDTVFFTPHPSWKDASVKSCKILLQFKGFTTGVDDNEGTSMYLDVIQLDPKEDRQLQLDNLFDEEDTTLNLDGPSESYDSEESPIPVSNKPNDNFSNFEPQGDLFDIGEDESIVGSEVDVDEIEDENSDEDQIPQRVNVLKRKMAQEFDSEDSDSNSEMDSESEPETLTSQESSFLPQAKKQKVENNDQVQSSLKSHVVAGLSGVAVGAALTFATLASLGGTFAENT